jgi:hypothetical protein
LKTILASLPALPHAPEVDVHYVAPSFENLGAASEPSCSYPQNQPQIEEISPQRVRSDPCYVPKLFVGDAMHFIQPTCCWKRKYSARRRPVIVYLWSFVSYLSFRPSVSLPFLFLFLFRSFSFRELFPFPFGSCTRAVWPTYVYKPPKLPLRGTVESINPFSLNTCMPSWPDDFCF